MKAALRILAAVLTVFAAGPAFAGHAHQHGSHSHGNHKAAQKIEISVTEDGFVASATKVKVGEPVTLIVTRKVEKTCATEIVIKEYGVNQALPLNKPVTVKFTPTKAGAIRYACAMDMIAGSLDAE